MFRHASWAIFTTALLAPTGWAWFQLGAFNKTHPESSCGLPVLGIYVLALFGAGLLSFLATGLGLVAYSRLPRPRPAKRSLELVVLFAPAITGIIVLSLVLYGG